MLAYETSAQRRELTPSHSDAYLVAHDVDVRDREETFIGHGEVTA
ncbi:hypothetical protein CIP107534_01097 [Corynebacterium diphtheriae]|nr:hypothetical protein CIP107534_01097 [Corynebacterium diphtheriae]CAB0748091.1 hypothetical protein FRC0119_01081 [Corynebacterium diphtheriae]CAB0879929.1 hypothetical protein FRC0402_00935 [Corynebacterium diphtheriae]